MMSMVGIFWVAVTGGNVEQDSYEAARVYHKLKSKYDGKDHVNH